MAKEIKCEKDGKIYYGTVLKSGKLSDKDKVEITDDAISAVLMHLISMDDFDQYGYAGYSIPSSTDKEKSISLVIFPNDMYELRLKDEFRAKFEIPAVPKKKRGVRRKTNAIDKTVTEVPEKPRRPRKKKAENKE